MTEIIAIIGGISSGKTTFCKKIKNKKHSIIEVDDVRRYVLWSSLEQKHINVRKYIVHKLHINHFDNNFFFDRTSFTKEIFEDKNKLFLINQLVKKEVFCKVQKEERKNKKVFIVWSFMLEDNYFFNRFIYCNMQERNRIKNMGLDFLDLKIRSNFEFGKLKKLKKLRNKSGCVIKNFNFLKVRNV